MSVANLDFGKLSLQDALDLAVLVEEEAKERYEEFASQMETHHTPEAASFFLFMAGNEEKHRAELAGRRLRMFGRADSQVTRAMLFDVEAPDYDEARAFMTPRQAMLAALRSEEKAHAFFVEALLHVTEPSVKALFAELRDEEVEHQTMVKKEIARLPPDPPLGTKDYEDEPVAQ